MHLWQAQHMMPGPATYKRKLTALKRGRLRVLVFACIEVALHLHVQQCNLDAGYAVSG